MYRATDVKLGLSTGTVKAQPNASNISTKILQSFGMEVSFAPKQSSRRLYTRLSGRTWQPLRSLSFAEQKYIPLTSRVRGPYCKLRNKFFSPSIYGPSAKRAGHKSKGKKRESVTYSTDREDEVSKIFVISLLCA